MERKRNRIDGRERRQFHVIMPGVLRGDVMDVVVGTNSTSCTVGDSHRTDMFSCWSVCVGDVSMDQHASFDRRRCFFRFFFCFSYMYVYMYVCV